MESMQLILFFAFLKYAASEWIFALKSPADPTNYTDFSLIRLVLSVNSFVKFVFKKNISN